MMDNELLPIMTKCSEGIDADIQKHVDELIRLCAGRLPELVASKGLIDAFRFAWMMQSERVGRLIVELEARGGRDPGCKYV